MPSNDYNIQTLTKDQVVVLQKAVTALKDALPEDSDNSLVDKKRKLVATEATDWREELRLGNLHRYTVNELKEALVRYGKKAAGKKAAMIARLKESMEEAEGN